VTLNQPIQPQRLHILITRNNFNEEGFHYFFNAPQVCVEQKSRRIRSTDVEKRLQECKKCGTPDESSCKSAGEVRNEIEGRADRIFQLEIVTGTALVVKYFPIPQCTLPRFSLFIVVYS
jgi:hypothetical protein